MSNTITAFFKGRVGVCESLYQYDYGMVMVLDGVDFGSVFDSYFQTTGEEDAIPVVGINNRVAIPDTCLLRPGLVTLHIPVHTGLNDSEVEYIVTFRVINRARPIYDGTPEESTAIAKAIAALQNIQGDVDAWLNDHPEATTTVDYRITNKMFNTVEQMVADATLVNNSKAKTLGFYEANDGGGAEYLIRSLGDDTADGATLILLANGLAAELIINDATVNIKQLGAKPQDDSRHDIASYLGIFESKLRNKAKLYIPMGVWNCSGYLFTKPVHVFGDYNFTKASNGGLYTTVIAPYNASQSYVIKISDTVAGIVPSFTFTNVVLSSAFFDIGASNYTFSSYATLSDGVLILDGAEFGTIDNIMFMYTNCKCMVFKGCCEILIKNLNIRIKDDSSTPAILFVKNTERDVNSSIIFETTQVEGTFGSIFEFRNYTLNCEFGNIMFEPGKPVTGTNRISCINENYDDTAVTRTGLFHFANGPYVEGVKIGSINCDGFSAWSVDEGVKHIIYDSIFTGTASKLSISIESITLSYPLKKFYLFSGVNGDDSSGRFGGSASYVDFGQLMYSTSANIDPDSVYPEVHSLYVPKYKISRKNNYSRYIFANELYLQSDDAYNIENSIWGNNYRGIRPDLALTPEHCAIIAMQSNDTDNKDRLVGRFMYDENINSISFRTTSVQDATATIKLIQNDTVQATLDVTNSSAMGVWGWHTIDSSSLTSLVDGFVDINFVVDGWNRGALDCCLIQ